MLWWPHLTPEDSETQTAPAGPCAAAGGCVRSPPLALRLRRPGMRAGALRRGKEWLWVIQAAVPPMPGPLRPADQSPPAQK